MDGDRNPIRSIPSIHTPGISEPSQQCKASRSEWQEYEAAVRSAAPPGVCLPRPAKNSGPLSPVIDVAVRLCIAAGRGRGVREHRWELASDEVSEVDGKVGERRGILGDCGQRFFFGGFQLRIAEASLGTGDGELLQGFQHLTGPPPSAALEFGPQVIAFLRPLRRRLSAALGLGDPGEGVVVGVGFLEVEGFADRAGGVGVAFGNSRG